MNKNELRNIVSLWIAGLAALILRLFQNAEGFDAVTGLPRSSAAGVCLPLLLVFSAIAEGILAFHLPKRSADFADLFAPPEKELTAVVCGSLLLAAGGVLMAVEAFLHGSIAAGAAGLLAIAAGAGNVVINRQLRAKETELSVMPLLPAMFFGVFFVLAVYLPLEDDPVFSRYYLPILASAVTANAFSLLAGFCRHETGLRSFSFTAGLSVVLCLASAADAGIANRLLFAGCAVILSAYLLLRRDPDDLPEEPEEEKKKANA